jgi:hypothetical protein
VHADGQYSEAAGVFIREGLGSLLPWLPRAAGLGGQGGYVQQQQQQQLQYSQTAPSLGASEAAAAAAAANTYGMYVSSNSRQQRARLAALKTVLAAAVQSVQAGTDADATAGNTIAGGADSAAAAVDERSVQYEGQQQLQQLSVQVCRAAAELQLLCACMTTQELQAVQQQLVGPGLQQQHRTTGAASTASRSRSEAAAGQRCEETQPGAGTSTGTGVSRTVSRQQANSQHLVPALQLQQTLAAQLIVLQAASVAGAGEAPANAATCAARAAAGAVLQSVTARQWLGLPYLGLPAEIQQQRELLSHLHTLQRRQQQHLRACGELLGSAVDMSCPADGGHGADAAHGFVDTGGSSRVAVAAATNSLQRGLLQRCVALLRLVDDRIAEQVAQV